MKIEPPVPEPDRVMVSGDVGDQQLIDYYTLDTVVAFKNSCVDAALLERDQAYRSKPHGHCTHPRCRDIWSAYMDVYGKLAKLEPEGKTPMVLNKGAQPV